MAGYIGSKAVLLSTTAATVTGDMKVDVDTLVVDSANNRVGIGTTSPAAQLDVVGTVRLTNTANSANFGTISDGGGLVINSQNNNPMYLYTGGAERMRIDSSGNVGIGTSSPTHKLTVGGYSNVNASNKLAIGDNAGYQGLIYMESANETLTIENTSDYSGRATIFKDNGAERMRIASGGDVLIGKSSASATGAGLWMYTAGGNYGRINYGSSITGTSFPAIFYNNSGSSVGSITYTTTTTSYNTSSDYRLKENVVALDGATERLAKIPVHRFNFINEPDRTVDGFIAHEVQAIVPEAVAGEKDAVDADGNPVHQGIDQSKLVPLLTAALQEALTEITDLKARVEALEAV